LREHAREITWFAPIQLAPGVDAASLTITGKVEGQACNPQTCIPFTQELSANQGSGVQLPTGVDFTTSAATPPATATAPPQASSVPPKTAQRLAPIAKAPDRYDLSQVSLATGEEGSFFYYLLTAFLGGLILNVMPCVLPVIGLKVMSFVQQAGQSRAHALALNCWYSAGIVAVFLALAGFAVVFNLGWGSQFSSAAFNISLIGIVFAMALSLLGMWEVPIPGFIGTGAAVEITEREGPTAAFLKGILTTLLATPCLGPFMAPALFWAVSQPTWMTFAIFATVGLGMASPYLLIGAFPNLIRFLPKPGAWMETFKKIMGLVLLATVVWLLTFIEAPLVVPTVALMVGIATGCWWVSQTPVTAPLDQKAYGWVTALMIVVIAGMSAYGWLYRDVMKPRHEKTIAKCAEEKIGEHRINIAERLGQIDKNLGTGAGSEQLRELIEQLAVESSASGNGEWQNFSLSKLGKLTLVDGRTVLVDFTADWCLTCKTLEKLVLHTQAVQEAITIADVVTMEADYTKRPAEIERTIKALGGVGVPLIAIFPGNDPYHPHVFSDGQYTKDGIIQAIAEATGRKDLMQQGGNAALSRSGGQEARR
jgi:thiol:disulfide interchange protein DsbD